MVLIYPLYPQPRDSRFTLNLFTYFHLFRANDKVASKMLSFIHVQSIYQVYYQQVYWY